MQTIFCLMAARTLQNGNNEGKESKRSEKLFSFQKHFTSDKVTITKLFCFVARTATWIWVVFLWLICTKSAASEKALYPLAVAFHEALLRLDPLSEHCWSKNILKLLLPFSDFGGKFFPVHANALNFNHENIIIKNTTEVRGIKSFQTSIKCQPDMNQLGCLAFRHLHRNESFKNK